MAITATRSASQQQTSATGASPAPPHARHRPTFDNHTCRFLGIVVFLAGVALIVYVFMTAVALFHQEPPHVPTVAALQGSGSTANIPSAALDIGKSLVNYIKQLLVLLLMCLAGSLIASRGIHMYFSAYRAHVGEHH